MPAGDTTRKEEEMSNGDVQSKVQEALDRKEMLQKLGKVEQVAKDVEALKNQGGKVPEQLIQEIDNLKAGMEGVKKDTKDTRDYCTKFPEFCERQKRLEQKIDGIEQAASAPKTVKFGEHELGHADVKEMFQCCDSDNPESCSTNKFCDQIPASLKAKMLRAFCDDPECQKELERQGFQLTGKGYDKKYRGMLG